MKILLIWLLYLKKSFNNFVYCNYPINFVRDIHFLFLPVESISYTLQNRHHPTTRIPNSSVRPSVTKKPGCNISGAESRIIKPLVAVVAVVAVAGGRGKNLK